MKRNLNLLPMLPWKDANGEDYPIHELKLISKNWTFEIWEAYLVSLDGEQNEELAEDEKSRWATFEDHADFKFENYLFQAQEDGREVFENELKALLRENLSRREREIFWMRHWNDMTTQMIADDLEISRRSVREILRRAYKKVRQKIFFNKFIKTNFYKYLNRSAV